MFCSKDLLRLLSSPKTGLDAFLVSFTTSALDAFTELLTHGLNPLFNS
jgi:hypothetical protein